jgi:putative ABC transport system ATP-binding protein
LRAVSKQYGRTVVMVTHDPRIAAYADRIIFLKDGKVVDETILERKSAVDAENVVEKMKGLSD